MLLKHAVAVGQAAMMRRSDGSANDDCFAFSGPLLRLDDTWSG